MGIFGNIFSSLFKKKNRSVIGIDIGTSAIKIVQLRREGGRAVLETYGSLALGPYAGLEIGRAASIPIEKVVGAVLDLSKEAGITTAQSALAIPFSSSLVTNIEVPGVPEKELPNLVPIEARKYIPVPISEVILDWSLIPKKENAPKVPLADERRRPLVEKHEILLVAIHNDVLKTYEDILKRSRLETGVYEIEIFSAMRSVLTDEQEPVLIFDMGAATTKLYVAERGAIRNSHTISRGSQNLTATLSKSLGLSVDKAEVLKRSEGLTGITDSDVVSALNITLDHIFKETMQVISSYEKNAGKKISKVVMVGGGAALKGLLPKAKTALGKEVVIGNPFSKVVTPPALADTLKAAGPEFGVAIGLALRRLQEL